MERDFKQLKFENQIFMKKKHRIQHKHVRYETRNNYNFIMYDNNNNDIFMME